jgi:uncharacterized peroxidase-related enzyme
MSFLRSLAGSTPLLKILIAYPDTAKPLIQYHQILLRGASPFSVAQRELIAAFVSAVNSCDYCHEVHSNVAAAFGVERKLFADLIDDIDAADIEAPMKPVLRYVRKLTLTPAKMTDADAQGVYDAGWNDKALHDLVSICALFNMMNRLVEGMGVSADEEYYRESGDRLHQNGYEGLLKILEDKAGESSDA